MYSPAARRAIYVPYRPDIDEERQDLSLGTDPHASQSSSGLDLRRPLAPLLGKPRPRKVLGPAENTEYGRVYKIIGWS